MVGRSSRPDACEEARGSAQTPGGKKLSAERPQPERWGRQGLYSPAPLLSLASCGGKQRKQRLLGRQEVSFQNVLYSQLKAGGEESRRLHLSGHAPQNGLTFKGKAYELPGGPQSHLLAEREGGSPEELGQGPTETPVFLTAGISPSTPGQASVRAAPACTARGPSHPHIHSPIHPQRWSHTLAWFPGLAQPVPLQPIHSPSCRSPQTFSPSGCLSTPSYLWPPLTPCPPSDPGSTISASPTSPGVGPHLRPLSHNPRASDLQYQCPDSPAPLQSLPGGGGLPRAAKAP